MTSPGQPHPPARRDRVEHRAERAYEVPVSPDEVWEAIATAEGMSAWMLPTRLDPRVGGEVAFDLDGTTMVGVVTDCTPHQRFAYELPWPLGDTIEDVPDEMARWLGSLGIPMSEVDPSAVTPVATEFLVEATSGGSCVIRVVTSAYGTGADWENEFFAEMVTGSFEIIDRLAGHLGGTTARPGAPA